MTLEQVMEKYPTLGSFGFGIFSYRNKSNEEIAEELRQKRLNLMQSADRVEAARLWISRFSKLKNINKNGSSYGLKHIAEREIGYITNGELIAAALMEGFDVMIEGPNGYFNISQKAWQTKLQSVFG